MIIFDKICSVVKRKGWGLGLCDYTALAVFVACVLTLAWWEVEPRLYPPYRLIESKAIPIEVKNGQFLLVTREWCIDKPTRGKVIRYFEDGIRIWLPTIDFVSQTVGCVERHYPVMVPSITQMPPGAYKLVTWVQVDINPLHSSQLYRTEDIKFTVIK